MAALPPQWFPEHDNNDEIKPLARALLYPYPAPTGDFYMQNGSLCLVPEGIRADKLRGRIPVLGVGSNCAPLQLRRKFRKEAFLQLGLKFDKEDFVPVTAATLHNADVVFAAHLSSYCAVPATAVASPGTRVTLNIAWLDSDQFMIMNDTEDLGGVYDLIGYEKGMVTHGCRPDGDDEVFHQPIYGYEACNGVLGIDGGAVAHAGIRAEGRHLPEMDQTMMFEKLRPLLNGVDMPGDMPGDMPLKKWINHMRKHKCQRIACAEELKSRALSKTPSSPWEVVDAKICDCHNQ